MTISPLRKQMQQQIETLPEDVLREVADFMEFVLERRRIKEKLADWDDNLWQQMALEQAFRESGEVVYTIDDAVEVCST